MAPAICSGDSTDNAHEEPCTLHVTLQPITAANKIYYCFRSSMVHFSARLIRSARVFCHTEPSDPGSIRKHVFSRLNHIFLFSFSVLIRLRCFQPIFHGISQERRRPHNPLDKMAIPNKQERGQDHAHRHILPHHILWHAALPVRQCPCNDLWPANALCCRSQIARYLFQPLR